MDYAEALLPSNGGYCAEEAGEWNEEFEKRRALIFASTYNRGDLRTIWKSLKEQGADFYVIERRLQPQPRGAGGLSGSACTAVSLASLV